jgi:choline dehydrogenase
MNPHHIIVGAGSAGSVLAARLSEDPDTRVLLLEAGGRDSHPAIHIPILAGVAYFLKSINWGYDTIPEPHLDDRVLHWPRGKTLGGSSSINGMMYIRGHRGDYDSWAQMGNPGWDYDSVLPYFKRTERHKDRKDDFHGSSGEWHIQRAHSDNPLYAAFFEACGEVGFKPTSDFNGESQEGFNWHDFNIKNGRRHSTARALLYPAMERSNLDIETRAQVRKILIEDGRAVGVEYIQRGEIKTVHCTGEVILSGGAINSPQLLELSGIGDADRLKALGIDVAHHLPGVGENMHDHLGIYVQYECTEPVTMYRWFRPDRAVAMMLQAIFLRTGVGVSLPLEAGLITRTRPEVDQPDMKISLVPGLSLETSQKGQGRNGFLIHGYQLRPQSRGHVHITSADPMAKPEIHANYLASEADRICIRDGFKIIRNLFSQPAFKPWLGPPISPTDDVQSDDEIDAWIRANSNTVFHPVGSCKMGPETDGMAVVGADLKVHGLKGLRVADASIMPSIMSGNTQAPTVMIAEKAADLIRAGA